MLLRKEQMLSRLHFFIFGATIVGETAVTSLIVSAFGSDILSKLYLLNGGILLFLPILFFKKIDSVNRGSLLKNVLRIAAVLVAVLFIAYFVFNLNYPLQSKYILLLFYPVSYLLKTVLFLTFWIMSTDICEPSETKTVFPHVASSGFIGGLSGALFSWFLLNFLNAESILVFWALLYLVAYFSVQSIVVSYNDKLIPKEVVPIAQNQTVRSFVQDAKDVFSNSLVRHIGILHFGIFVSVFLVDFHFWQQCSTMFSGAGKLTQFQYGFYIFHSLATILLLRFVTPDLIALRGFTRIFSYLPLTLLLGSFLYVNILYLWGANRYTFSFLLLWQLFRYLSFENFFSPIYQMFFAAVEKEKRGRAKTVIEGFVKPLAIIAASIVISLIGKYNMVLVGLVCVISLLMFLEALKIKHAYMKSLIRTKSSDEDEVGQLVSNIGSTIEKECIDIIREFAVFSSRDMKRVAIKLLVKMDRNESNSALNQLVMQSVDVLLVREAARYAGEIKHNMFLLHFLVEHDDPAVWHRAVLSLVLNKSYLTEFRTYLTRYFWVGETEDRVYAGMYLCCKEKSTDLPHLRSFLDSLVVSEKQCNVELAVLAYTVLQIPGWDKLVASNFTKISPDIAKISIRHMIEKGSESATIELLDFIVASDQERSMELLVREIDRSADIAAPIIEQLIGLSTFSEEKTIALIKSLGTARLNRKSKLSADFSNIRGYAEKKLISVYNNCAALQLFPVKRFSSKYNDILEAALQDQLFIAAECAIDALAVIDETGFLAEGRRELRIEEPEERVVLIELLESSRDSLLKDLTIPILETFDVSVYAEMTVSRLGSRIMPDRIFETSNCVIVGAALALLGDLGSKTVTKLGVENAIFHLALSGNYFVKNLAEHTLYSIGGGMAKHEDTVEILNRVLFLKKNELFAPVSAVRLMRLAEGVQEIIYQDGDRISREGDRANHLYLMKDGTADLVMGYGLDAVKFGEIFAGDAYGEVGLFNQDVRSASVIATSRCRVYVLSRSYLRKMVSQIPELANTFLQVLGRKLQTSHDELVRLQKSVSELN